MLASLRARSFAPTLLLLGVAALTAGAASCADSIHLDPPGTGGKDGGATTSTGTHGTGGSTGGACSSNPDCAYPQPVCDTVTSTCVECLTADDCAVTKPGTVCSLGACVCAPEGAAALTYCAASTGKPNRCVDTQTSASDCGTCNKACFGSCTAGKCADRWRPIATAGAPAARQRHAAIWTGSKMFVWGGQTAGGVTNTGGLYDPATDSWTPTSTVNAPSARHGATVVWDDTDKLVLVWGGFGPGGGYLGTGGMYNPKDNTWTAIPTANAPTARAEHTAVWASFEVPFEGAVRGMIVWGGADLTGYLGDGAVFDPAEKKWAGAVDGGANGAIPPSARGLHTAVWDSGLHAMMVWGGYNPLNVPDQYLGDGALWIPKATQTPTAWDALPTLNAPTKRAEHTAVLALDTAYSMIVWGGYDGANHRFDGQQYKGLMWGNLGAISPEERKGHTAVWVDASKQMIIFGGDQGSAPLDTAWSLDGATLVWTQLPTAPAARTRHTAVAAGSSMIVWGGDATGNGNSPLGDGAIYDASASP